MTQGHTWNIAVVVWALAVGGIAWDQLQYETTPIAPTVGQAAPPPYARLDARAGQPLVVMGVHPRCPCTRASLINLATLRPLLARGVQVRVLHVIPDGADASPQWENLPALPAWITRSMVVRDGGGRLAGTLGMHTSGQVAAFDSGGRAVFAGGITSSRGQQGDNDALRRLVAALDAEITEPALMPVLGCALEAPSNRAQCHGGEHACQP